MRKNRLSRLDFFFFFTVIKCKTNLVRSIYCHKPTCVDYDSYACCVCVCVHVCEPASYQMLLKGQLNLKSVTFVVTNQWSQRGIWLIKHPKQCLDANRKMQKVFECQIQAGQGIENIVSIKLVQYKNNRSQQKAPTMIENQISLSVCLYEAVKE